MAPRDFEHILDDMLGAIAGIQTATREKTLEDYRADWLLKHAVQRAIEIISEASRQLPDDVEPSRAFSLNVGQTSQ